jgi:glutamate dehydrogenase/leucine dehydrogenase
MAESNLMVLDLATLTPDEFVTNMLESGITRGYFTFIDGEFHSSHEALATLANFVKNSPDYNEHEGIFFQADEETGCLFLAGIHRTNRGSGHGGTRFKEYETVKEMFADVMRLSKGMTDKNACAEIWYGGGKAIIYAPDSPRKYKGSAREQVFANYGRFIASLNGVYITAEDMNTSPEDMAVIHANNRFCTCLPVEIGGSSNPSAFTALGVFRGLLAAVHFVDGKNDVNSTSLTGKHIIVQGAGNVGGRLIDQLIYSGAKVTVFDLDDDTKTALKAKYPANQLIIHEDGNSLYAIEADVFSPNAIGAVLNDKTIPMLNVKIIAGGANNQLETPIKHANDLYERGIVYVPDFIINRMGIVNCSDEPNGYLPDEVETAADNVYPAVYSLLEDAKKIHHSPQFEAINLAEELSKINHPIRGHRGIKIIKHIIAKGWGE